MFSAADSLVFRRVSYPDADRLINFELIARIAPGVSLQQLSQMMPLRSEAVLAAAGARAGAVAVPMPLRSARVVAEQRRMLLILLGAALSLLFIACANAASLELAGALSRAKTYAIQLALGASRGALVRTALAEEICLVGTAAAVAGVLADLGAGPLVRYLPPSLTGSPNPIDVDGRALLFMAGFAGLTLILAWLPVVAFAWRADLLELLKMEGQSVAAGRVGSLGRRALTVAQVGLAVMLLVGSVLYVRSHLALLRLDKGFDSSGVVAITLTIPPQLLGTAGDRAVLARTILERLRARPGVVAAFEGSPPPSTGDSPTAIDRIEVDGRPEGVAEELNSDGADSATARSRNLREIARAAGRTKRTAGGTLTDMSTEELLAEALRLSRQERARVAEELLSSLEEADDEVAAAWATELQRRSREVAEGRVQTTDWETVRTEILRELEQRRAGRTAS